MRHEKKCLMPNSSLDIEEAVGSVDAERPISRRQHERRDKRNLLASDILEGDRQSMRYRRHHAALLDRDDSTATPSLSSSNQPSRRSSTQLSRRSSAQADDFVCGESPFRKVHAERLPRRQLLGDHPSPASWPNVFPGWSRRAMGTCSESEPESDQSLGRGSSLGSAGYVSSSAYDGSLGPCASTGNSATPRQQRNRSRSGSSNGGGRYGELRDHLDHHIRGAAALHRSKGSPVVHFPPPPPPDTPLAKDHTRGMPSSASASALFASHCEDAPEGMSTSASALALFTSYGEDGPEASPSLGKKARGSFGACVQGMKLPSLARCGSAPQLFSSAPARIDVHEWGFVGGGALQDSAAELSSEGRDDDLEVMDLGPLTATVASSCERPPTAWGTGRSRKRSGMQEPQGPHGQSSAWSRDGWQLSLCQNVAIHCSPSLPSKETFAQRKVPRPVSPLLVGGSGELSTAPMSADLQGHIPLHASIGDMLQKMRRVSDSDSSAECDGINNSVDPIS